MVGFFTTDLFLPRYRDMASAIVARMDAVTPSRFSRIEPDGACTPVDRALAVEVPVAVEVNGIGYAVMMATPADLEDFAWGFVASERLGEVIDIETHAAERGMICLLYTSPSPRDS